MMEYRAVKCLDVAAGLLPADLVWSASGSTR